MFKRSIVILFSWLILSKASASVDLLAVYQQAFSADPTYMQARADAFTTEDNIAIAKAGLLPSLALTGTAVYTHIDEGDPSTNGTNNQYTLQLTEPLFNYTTWLTYQNSEISAKSAEATLASALQDLMARVTEAYLNQAENQRLVELNEAYVNSLTNSTQQTELQFKAGLAKGADVSSAEAAAANSQIALLNAQNSYLISVSQLQAITGISFANIALLQENLPNILVPTNLNALQVQALNNNLDLLAARFAMLAARKNIDIQNSGHYPQLSANLAYSGNQSNNNGLGNTSSNGGTAGLSLNFPIYQGGLVVSETQQAIHEYQSKYAQYLASYRTTIANTQQNYQTLIADIQKIQAGQIAVAANEKNYQQMRVSYEAGIRTMVDVLLAQQSLFQAQLNYIQAQYSAILAYVQLKQALGTLNMQDLIAINHLLSI